MCRLLAVVSRNPIDVESHLQAFTRLCAASREYQGHGWGCAAWRGTSWERYRSVNPIWDDPFRPTGEVRLMLAHARSAFRNEDISVENNMPFISNDQAFIFNGELRGVRLPVQGRTGAHRLFRFIQNLHRQHNSHAVSRAMKVLRRRTAHIRACNFMLTDATHLHVHSLFTSEPDYFTLHIRRAPDELVVCSSPYPDDNRSWSPLDNDSIQVFPCSL